MASQEKLRGRKHLLRVRAGCAEPNSSKGELLHSKESGVYTWKSPHDDEHTRHLNKCICKHSCPEQQGLIKCTVASKMIATVRHVRTGRDGGINA